MVKIPRPFAAHKAGGLPYLVYLRHPTTGGVLRLVGVARPRHGRRARRADRLPRARGSTRRCTARRSRPACRWPRTSTRTAWSTPCCRPRSSPRSSTGPSNVAARTARGLAGRRRRCRTRRCADVPAWDSVTRSRRADRPGVRRAAQLARHRRGAAQRHRGRASRTRACCWRWPGSVGRPASCSARTAAGRRPTAPLGPAGLREARAACGSPPSSAAAGHRHRHRRVPPCRRRPRRAAWPARSPAAWPSWSMLAGADRLPCCSGRAPAGGRSPWCRPTGSSAAQHAWLSPLPPEGATAIVYRDTDRAPRDGRQQGVRSLDLLSGRHRRPDRRRAPRRRRRAGGLLPADGAGASSTSSPSCCRPPEPPARLSARLAATARLGDASRRRASSTKSWRPGRVA